MKSATVDLVVAGNNEIPAAALDAIRRGQRILVVLRADDRRAVRRWRRRCRDANHQPRVMTGAEVVCVDGTDGVEAVVVRYTRTGRLCGINTSAFLRWPPTPER